MSNIFLGCLKFMDNIVENSSKFFVNNNKQNSIVGQTFQSKSIDSS